MEKDAIGEKDVAAFKKAVWDYYGVSGRHALPWRKTRKPYHILVSEVMLQQTQVDRVISKYKAFIHEFPDFETLYGAPLSSVLVAWSGLGYNRRAKLLKLAAGDIVERFGGRVPKDAEALRSLPGVGEYTAGAVACFAYNEPVVMVETNIRTVFIRHFFPNATDKDRGTKIHDADIRFLVAQTLDHEDPRSWYYALMDYGAHLKKTYGNASRASAHYTRQSAFKGSRRQVRGAIVKYLIETPRSLADLKNALPGSKKDLLDIINDLKREGFIECERDMYFLSGYPQGGQ